MIDNKFFATSKSVKEKKFCKEQKKNGILFMKNVVGKSEKCFTN